MHLKTQARILVLTPTVCCLRQMSSEVLLFHTLEKVAS